MAIAHVDERYLEKHCDETNLHYIRLTKKEMRQGFHGKQYVSAGYLRTGARVDIERQGCVLRCKVLGYAPDGHDVPQKEDACTAK